MFRSIATVSVSGTLPVKFEAIASAGFDGVEIFENDLLYFNGSPRDVRRMAADTGLSLSLFQPFRDFEGVPAARFERNLERARRKFDLMGDLGIDKILVCSNVAPDALADRACIVDQLGALAELAAERGIVVGYEALAWGRHVNSYREAWHIVHAVNHAHLGIILDSFHTLSIDDDLSTLNEIPAEKIVFVQLADAPRMNLPALEWSRHFRCFPGQGELDVTGFLAPVIDAGYRGPISLEIFNDGFRAASSGLTAADGLRSLLWLEEQLAAQCAPAPRDSIAPASRPPELFNPPAVANYDGVEFLEFAVDESGAQRLGQWLTGLGFALWGQHRTKRVWLYRRGDARLILNSEPDSFAHHFFDTHGLSLCAAALRVDHAQQALERARAYGYQPYLGRVGPNERLIPAVQTPDGSLVYFVEQGSDQPTIYETDFVLRNPARDDPVSMLPMAIDHVCLAQPAESLDHWVLFCKTVFGLHAEPTQTLQDPYGLIRSRAMRSHDGSVRLTLNSSMDRHTVVARALDTYHGSGLHHLAFRVPYLVASVERLIAAGIPMLVIPRNYYEDLHARYGLPLEFIDTLERSRILYDRDEHGGELLHAYTAQLDGRFFVEILERRDGYDLYGAVNAPVRLAAHAQQAALSQNPPPSAALASCTRL